MRLSLAFALILSVQHAPRAFAEGKAAAEPAKPAAEGSLKTWFKHWKQALEKSSVEDRYQKSRTTAVAAVRGSQQGKSDPGKPYWKGSLSDKKRAKLMKEREELAQAVELILAGKLEEGGSRLEKFKAAHPKSPLLKDVEEAEGKLGELKAAAKPAEAAAPKAPPAPAADKTAPSPEPGKKSD